MIASEKDLAPYAGQVLPLQTPCLSFWQRTTRAFALLNVNHDMSVPGRSRYVVIGSGISGGLTAFELLEGGVNGEDIVILEAGEAASGASSRNAGHVRPDAFRGFSAYAKVHGPEQAVKIIGNERLVLERVDAFVKKHNVQCDFHHTTTFDVCMTPEFAAYEAESLAEYKAAGGDVSHIELYQGQEAKDRTRVPDAVAAYEWPAGSSHPAKLAQFLLQTVVDRGATLFTHCPALKISKVSSPSPSKPQWNIGTPRGTMVAETIVHCTNAYASYLLPHLAPHITPNRAQAHSLIPSRRFSGSEVLTKTFSLRYSLHHFYSLIQRLSDGVMILGVSRKNPGLSAETKADIVSTDNSSYNQEICDEAVNSLEKLFPESADVLDGKKGAVRSHGEGLDHAWSGIIGMTGDSVPFVGEVEGMKGHWICAGFNGHGMARIFTCAPGVAKLILGGTWNDTGLPECFQLSEERLERLTVQKPPSVW